MTKPKAARSGCRQSRTFGHSQDARGPCNRRDLPERRYVSGLILGVMRKEWSRLSGTAKHSMEASKAERYCSAEATRHTPSDEKQSRWAEESFRVLSLSNKDHY
jgi:hypothetical protein